MLNKGCEIRLFLKTIQQQANFFKLAAVVSCFFDFRSRVWYSLDLGEASGRCSFLRI